MSRAVTNFASKLTTLHSLIKSCVLKAFYTHLCEAKMLLLQCCNNIWDGQPYLLRLPLIFKSQSKGKGKVNFKKTEWRCHLSHLHIYISAYICFHVLEASKCQELKISIILAWKCTETCSSYSTGIACSSLKGSYRNK